MKNYKDLNRKELHKLFGRDISEYVFELDEEPLAEEKLAARFIERRYKIKLKHFPRVLFPRYINTPDFASVEDNVVLEIKSVESLDNGFNNAFKKASKQFKKLNPELKRIVFIFADKVLNKYSDQEIIREAIFRASFHRIEYFMITRKGTVLYIKEV